MTKMLTQIGGGEYNIHFRTDNPEAYKTVQEICRLYINKEKQTPKKPITLTYGLLIDYGWKYECPNCGCAIGVNKNLMFAYGEYLEPYENNCCSCGQALDWSDTE